MPHYLDEYAPQTGRWQAQSGRRYNLIVIDPAKTKLIPGRACAVTDTEEAAAVFYGFIPTAAWKRTILRNKVNPAPAQDAEIRNRECTMAAIQLVKHLVAKGSREAIIPVVAKGEDFEVVVRRKPPTTSHEAKK